MKAEGLPRRHKEHGGRREETCRSAGVAWSETTPQPCIGICRGGCVASWSARRGRTRRRGGSWRREGEGEGLTTEARSSRRGERELSVGGSGVVGNHATAHEGRARNNGGAHALQGRRRISVLYLLIRVSSRLERAMPGTGRRLFGGGLSTMPVFPAGRCSWRWRLRRWPDWFLPWHARFQRWHVRRPE